MAVNPIREAISRLRAEAETWEFSEDDDDAARAAELRAAAAALERLVTDPPGEVVEQICRRNNEDWGELQALDRIAEREKTRAVLRAAGEVELSESGADHG